MQQAVPRKQKGSKRKEAESNPLDARCTLRLLPALLGKLLRGFHRLLSYLCRRAARALNLPARALCKAMR